MRAISDGSVCWVIRPHTPGCSHTSAPYTRLSVPNPEFADHWLLDPQVTFVNHGSFGACPKPVLELQTELRAQIEREPILFLDGQLERRLDDARQPLAAFMGAN